MNKIKNQIKNEILNNSFPIVIYNDLLEKENKSRIYSENKSKCGIYRWVNLINNKSYIGCSINITTRLYSYYSIKSLKSNLLLGNCYICEALLKYGHKNFRLEILEYSNKEDLLSREQYYINMIKPEYNILKKKYVFRKYFYSIYILYL